MLLFEETAVSTRLALYTVPWLQSFRQQLMSVIFFDMPWIFVALYSPEVHHTRERLASFHNTKGHVCFLITWNIPTSPTKWFSMIENDIMTDILGCNWVGSCMSNISPWTRLGDHDVSPEVRESCVSCNTGGFSLGFFGSSNNIDLDLQIISNLHFVLICLLFFTSYLFQHCLLYKR